MILTDREIHDLMLTKKAIAPYAPALLNPTSLDVLLGDKIYIESPQWRQPLKAWSLLLRGVLLDDFWGILNGDRAEFLLVDVTNGYQAKPNEFLLASTQEVFNIPDDISCEFKLKSSRAREGWNHFLAVWAEAGFNRSVLTLELKNSTRYKKLRLVAGMRIGQLIFHQHKTCEKSYVHTGRYNGDRTVQPSKG